MIWKNNLLKDLRSAYIKMISEKYGPDESKQLLDILIESFYGYTRVEMALDPGIRLTESEILKLHAAVKELLANKPVQYITGKARFLDIELSVDESVLIPRPETEALVQLIIREEKTPHLQVLDIGTGSGCIAIALKKNLPDSEISAIDISPDAIKTAAFNSKQHRIPIQFQQVDILNPDSSNSLGNFDIVVSNPPYVMESDMRKMHKNVLDYEPHTALFVKDEDPLKYYRAILEFCQLHLRGGGRVYFEINEKQGENILQLFHECGFHRSELHTDIHDKNRFAIAIKNP